MQTAGKFTAKQYLDFESYLWYSVQLWMAKKLEKSVGVCPWIFRWPALSQVEIKKLGIEVIKGVITKYCSGAFPTQATQITWRHTKFPILYRRLGQWIKSGALNIKYTLEKNIKSNLNDDKGQNCNHVTIHRQGTISGFCCVVFPLAPLQNGPVHA